ncbi:MAG: hypothetical protein POH28_01165 [Acidocella sp.]|nr:hypothetical protein [Acidocella sp.]
MAYGGVLFYICSLAKRGFNMAVSEIVKEAISEVVRERFAGAQITSVNVTAGEDSDGDPVLRIFVIFEAERGKETLDAKKMSGLPRRLIEKLSEMDFDAFPMVSFVSAKDAKKLNFAAA